MKRRLSVLALCLFTAGAAWSLDAESQRLADRYRSILATNPGQELAFDRLWKIYATAGETDALIDDARKEAVHDPALSGRILLRAEKKEEAAKVWREGAAKGDVQAADLLAGTLEADGKAAEAAAVLEGLAPAQKNAALLLRLGALWQASGQADKARATWEQAVALAPDDLALRKKVAAACLRAGDGDAAIAHLKVIAEKGTPAERFDALDKMTGILEGSSKWPEAVASQEALLALMGADYWNLASAQRRLFRLRQQAGTIAELERQWRADAESHPEDPSQHLRLAALYEFQGQDAQRLEEIRQAARLTPKDLKLARDQAALELSSGAPEAAAATYDKILATHPDDAEVIFLRAEISALTGKEKEAESRIEDYLASHKDDETAETRARDFYKRLRLTAPLERQLAKDFAEHPDNESNATELARFYLDEHRYEEAAQSLARYQDSHQSPKDAAARAARFSNLLHDAKLNEEAVAWARKAADQDPAYVLQLADLLGASGDLKGEREVLEKGCDAQGSTLPREELDRRLFATLQALDKEAGSSLDPDKILREKIARLSARAAETKQETAWARLARWQRWNDDKAGAVATARAGLAQLGESALLQEMLAEGLAESGETPAAIEIFQKLAKAVPDRTVEFQRRIGHLELDSGEVDSGTKVFEALAAQQPNDWQATADLALAEQAGGNWFQAFDTWRNAYRLAPVEARRGLEQSILNAAQRLELYEQGLAFLEEAASTEADKNARDELLKEAATFAVRNHEADAWGTLLGDRIKSAPNDPRWKDGLAFLLHEEGRDDEARAALAKVNPTSEESPEGLEARAKTAEDARDWAEAARLVRRMISLRVSPSPELTMRYANDLENGGQEEEAIRAWEGGVARFARDPALLTQAAEYFERLGDDQRMENCYRAAARLGGGPPQVLLRLGRLALERGDRSQALDDFKAVLQATRPETATVEDCLPLPDRILTSTGAPAVSLSRGGWKPAAGRAMPWRRIEETTAEGCRLAAIRQASQLLANSPDKPKWLAGFPDKVEKAWALYYSGETEAAYGEILGLLEGKEPPLQIVQTLAALALESNNAAWLGHWAQSDFDEADSRWDGILAALARMLEARWRPEGTALETLFQSSPTLKQWQACQFLAKVGLYQAASALGVGVADRLPDAQAAEAWLGLAEWQIKVGDLDKAIADLDRAIAVAAPSCTYNDPLFSAIRARWLLSRPEDRPAFEKKLMAHLGTLKQAGCEAAAGAFLAALRGDHATATEQIKNLFSYLGPFPVEGWPEAAQSGGTQLEAWNMPRLARDLYRGVGRLDFTGNGYSRRATEQILIANQLAFAKSPGARLYFLNGWLTPAVNDEVLLQWITRFQQTGRDEAAAVVFQALCERDPRTEMLCAFLASLADYPLLREPAKAYLTRLLAENHPAMRPVTLQGAGLRLANLLEQDGEYDQELALLNRLRKDDPTGKPVLLQLVSLLGKLGRHREALALIQSTSGTPIPELVIPYAELMAAFGHETEAMDALEAEARRSDSPNRAVAANKLESMARDIGDTARTEEAKKLGPADIAKSPAPAKVDDWKKRLGELNRGTATPEERFRAGRALVESDPGPPEDLRVAEVRRLKKLAEKTPALRPEYYVMRRELAEHLGTTPALERELRTEWNGGHGNNLAGEILVQLLLAQQRYADLDGLLGEYLTEEHFNESAWNQIAQKLLNSDQPALAARVFRALNGQAPGEAKPIFALARALVKSGNASEARPLLETAERLAVLDPPRQIELAQYYLDAGESGKSHALLEAAAENPALTDAAAPVWMQLAGEAVKSKQWELAREAIGQAARYPQAVSGATVADYYLGQAEAAGVDPGSNEFHLPARQFRDLDFELASRLISSGQNGRAWSWIEAMPSSDPRWRALLQSNESDDWKRAAKLWEAAIAQTTLWDVKAGAAEFYQRRAATEGTPAARLKDLARAHELLPGSFSIAEAYAAELTRLKKYPAARKAYQDVIDACTQPAERRSAREKLQASSGLPQAG